MWLVQTLEHREGYWTRCASSDEGGGFVEGCAHKHPTSVEADTCVEANRHLGGVTGFPWKSPAEMLAEKEAHERELLAELSARYNSP